MADTLVNATLSVAWDGVTPATAPANSTLVLGLGEISSAGIEITGTFSATVTIEVTIDGTTWFQPACFNVDKTTAVATLTSAGRRLVQCQYCTALRVRMNPRSSGSAVVTIAGAWAPV